MSKPAIPLGELRLEVEAHPYPLLFATVSGAHLYGFPSADSDFDLRGVHLLPLDQFAGLDPGEETIERSTVRDGLEIDLVTHDAKKFFALMLKNNGYVLEQVFSPLVVRTSPEHDQLREIAKTCLTRHHAQHYLGFAARQWKLVASETPPRIKPLLYVFRVLLTGIHLLRHGEVEANLSKLNESAGLPFVSELVHRKQAGAEKERLDSSEIGYFEQEYQRLLAELELSGRQSKLPERPSGKEALNELLLRLRIGSDGRRTFSAED
jgi:predicted nucleotidyltransferase